MNLDYWDGNIDWYSPAEIIDQIYVDRSQRKITELGFEKSSAKMLPEGTVLFTSRAGIGKTAILAKKGCTNQGFQSIVPHSNKLDSYFIFSTQFFYLILQIFQYLIIPGRPYHPSSK